MAASVVWQITGKPQKNRQELYGGAYGLRILTFHATEDRDMPRFKRIIENIARHHEFIDPHKVDETLAKPFSRDKILLTFDDGFGSQFQAAKWLASKGIRATFFIVPSLIDRTVAEYVDFNRQNGIEPYFKPDVTRGLTTAELHEMMADGHLIAAHNFAHRNLGSMHDPEDLAYEIDNALDSVAHLTGAPCKDFAVAFGQPSDLSREAEKLLLERCERIYMCFRGLNVPGKTSAFLMRHDMRFTQPDLFHRLAIDCGVDHMVATRNRQMIERVGVLGEATHH